MANSNNGEKELEIDLTPLRSLKVDFLIATAQRPL
jgi:hypothetical protein